MMHACCHHACDVAKELPVVGDDHGSTDGEHALMPEGQGSASRNSPELVCRGLWSLQPAGRSMR